MIILDKISKSFVNNKVIDDLSAEFHQDKITSIVAPNGMGKTTLISMISGLMLPDTGKIEFQSSLKQRDVVIVLAGEKNLYAKNTAEENLYYFGIIRGHSRKEIRGQIDEFLYLFPLYSKIRTKIVEELSYGQKRLIALFSAIVSGAQCIIVDEASEGLDMEYVELIRELFQIIKSNRTIIITSHDYKFVAETADTSLLLKEGKIVKVLEHSSTDTLVEEYLNVFGNATKEAK